MLRMVISTRSTARRSLDWFTNGFYRLTQQNKLMINGLTIPHDLPVKRLGLWYDELDSQFLGRRRADTARYLARLVSNAEPCWVIFEPRYFAEVAILLIQMQRDGVRAKVFAAPGDPDRRIKGSRRVPCLSFLREILPAHSYELMTDTGIHESCSAIESGAASCRSAFVYSDASFRYAELTAAKKLGNLVLRREFGWGGRDDVRKFLNNVERDSYFVDGRFSDKNQLLVRERSGRNTY